MKTGGTKVDLPKASNKSGFKEGDELVCTKSQSCAYTEGGTYVVYKNDKGWLCLQGNDCLEDILSMMVSSFKVLEK